MAESDTVVKLSCDQVNAVRLPASVTIPAHSLSARFTVRGVFGSADVKHSDIQPEAVLYATIYGTVGDWIQGDTLTEFSSVAVVAALHKFTESEPRSGGGNQCAVLDWRGLPEGTVKGYNVYRYGTATGHGTVRTKLTPRPQASELFGDTGLQNDKVYKYVVSAVEWDGTECFSPLVLISPTHTSPSLFDGKQVIRSWSGVGPAVRLGWDGKDSHGNTGVGGSYRMKVIAYAKGRVIVPAKH
jgi:hypothetical protein